MANLRLQGVCFLATLFLVISCGVRQSEEIASSGGVSDLRSDTGTVPEGIVPLLYPKRGDLNGDGVPEFTVGASCQEAVATETDKIRCLEALGQSCTDLCQDQKPPMLWTGYWRGGTVSTPEKCECITALFDQPETEGLRERGSGTQGDRTVPTLDPNEPTEIRVSDPFTDPNQAHGVDRPQPKAQGPGGFGGWGGS